ncbi:UNVERIFIED_CONTAM: ABSCISIC ACID-INSENSITIVE 5-like protein 2 [Sesamum radiatum]|uniref:ABSCISIC ACID-INSENSITIVE 5-like protein 2 n=1 Tax=Sesamum radiatum TaxID=300843 RepID=A0AAW2LDR4_SESRA
MVAQRMGSQGGCGNSIGGTQIQTQDSKPNPLVREGSLYSLTLDEVQNQLGDLGKPLSSMNLDELLKTLWTAEANNQAMEGVDYGPSLQPGRPASSSSLNRQSSLTLSRDLSKKTVDEAGVVAESPPGKKNSGSVVGGVDPIGPPQQAQWINYPITSIHPQQQQQQHMLPVYMPGHPVQQPIPLGGNPAMEAAYSESQITMSSSPLMGTLSDTQNTRRKRVAPEDVVEKSVERRQKRDDQKTGNLQHDPEQGSRCVSMQ